MPEPCVGGGAWGGVEGWGLFLQGPHHSRVRTTLTRCEFTRHCFHPQGETHTLTRDGDFPDVPPNSCRVSLQAMALNSPSPDCGLDSGSRLKDRVWQEERDVA